MRQIKNCKVGHFVRYNGILCQINCFFTGCIGGYRVKQATLIQVGRPEEPKRVFTPRTEEKVEYLGDTATDDKGKFWVFMKKPDQEMENFHL